MWFHIITPGPGQFPVSGRKQLKSSSTLPADLSKVEFRGAAIVTYADHKAVFLKDEK
jgi:hypothetical protein